ncbi:MAG: hypothetical protein HZA48_10920 [Planctomycetes bacterium]|nr:hypothetical protein [Planctomycetota bacterium]
MKNEGRRSTVKKTAIILVLTFLLLAIAYGCWYKLEPYYYIWMLRADKKGEEGSIKYSKKLVECGDRAIIPIIQELKSASPFLRGACYLPGVLRDLKLTAYSCLKEEYERTPDSSARTNLLYALMLSFNDLSQFDAWLAGHDSKHVNICTASFIERHLTSMIKSPFPGIFSEENGACKVNTKFIAWWLENKEYLYWDDIEKSFLLNDAARKNVTPINDYLHYHF